MKVNIGDIGTKGGLVTDVNGQVLTGEGGAIAGLYAIGNTSASVMRQTYSGAGSTLGPAMTFGYLAANHLAAQQPEVRSVPSSTHTSVKNKEFESAVES